MPGNRMYYYAAVVIVAGLVIAITKSSSFRFLALGLFFLVAGGVAAFWTYRKHE